MRLLAGLSLLAAIFLPQISSKSVESRSGTPGIKMTTRFVADGTTDEETIFLEADRARTEYRPALRPVHGDGTHDTRPGPRLADIARCDLGQAFDLNLEDREYVVTAYPRFKLTKQDVPAPTENILQKVAPWVPTVREETTTVDTGERKDFFGHEARHVITTWKKTPLAGSHLDPQDSVTDGWYIDLDTSISCESRWQPRNVGRRHEYYAVGGERHEIIDDGIRVMGFAIERRRTSRWIVTASDGTKRPNILTSEEKISEFYEGPLDLALFEVPDSFRKVSELRLQPPLTLADRWYFTRAWVQSLAHDLLK
jgi:hypothetical protein